MPDSIEFKITVADEQVKDILIARLAAAGANGFEEGKNLLKAFVPVPDFDETVFEEIIKETGLPYLKSVIPEHNWNAAWEADFKPVSISTFCTIRAGFHAADTSVTHDIVITPKMSFGTGHHATTCLMLKAMEALDLHQKAVFDFGTGTGILSILAEKCGARNITAIDCDDWSINNAAENLVLNNCRNVSLYKGDALPEAKQYDIILANINRNIILQHLASLKQHLALNGVVLLSGLLTGDEAVIVTAAGTNGLTLQAKTEMNGWICLLMVSA